jgi:hypothetical protein
MNKLNKTLFVILTIAFAGVLSSANAQVVYFNGLGRALVTSESLKGNVLRPDTSIGQPRDTTSKRKSTDGYTLFDLGVNAQPNESLRASAILRVRNAFGGFYGDGTTLQFRQIRLDGIIAKKVKYEIGDIDLELTPYTLFNFEEMYNDYEADIFAIRRSVVAYENFNFGNKWRMQGAHAQANFRFDKVIERIGVRAFATRTQKTNFLNTPDRLLVGGRLDVLQSKYFQIGANYVHMADLPQTAVDTMVLYKNDVTTFDGKLTIPLDDIEFGLQGEFGFSTNSFRLKGMVDTATGNDFFYDAGLFVRYKPLNIKVYGSYRDVGYYFTSPGAQTRRIYDVNGPANTLFPTIHNNSVARTPIMLDRMSDETTRNTSIQTALMMYLPHYNNVTPYGQATPNRKGMTFGVSAGDADRLLKADVIVDLLQEGTPETVTREVRKFTAARGGVLFNAHKLLRFEKVLAVTLGARYEETKRAGLSNNLNFQSTVIDAGLTVEVVKQLDLLAGYKYLAAKGDEVIAIRNQFNTIDSFVNMFGVDEKQGLISYGLRYRFSKNTYFTAQGIHSDNKFAPVNTNYGINQVFLNYTMIF